MAVSPAPCRLHQALLATVAYADLFDFPLARLEVHRDLIGVAATADDTFAAIDRALARGDLAEAAGYLMLPGRGDLGALRRERRARATRRWPLARRYGGRIARLPFVRLVAVSGSLAAENPDERADFDYLIVTAPGRLWLVRAMTILLVRAARLRGVRLCPNYLLTTRALALGRRDLYTAHELLQIVPLAGGTTYWQLLAENRWAADWLPNRFRQASNAPAPPPPGGIARRVGELALGSGFGDRLEAWEARRKQRRFGSGDHGARFTDDICEGHYGRARQRVLREFEHRCALAGVTTPPPLGRYQAGAVPQYSAAGSLAAGDK